jgi:type IV pilus assembly protein PilC
MDYSYVAYTIDKKLVKGRLTATTEEAANNLLSYGGYQVVSLKPLTRFIDKEKLLSRLYRIKPREIIMFSRQLALLLESGTDIVTSLDLLQSQINNQTLKRIIGEVASDIRGGSSLSTALSKYPQAFSRMYHRAIAAGEQGGNLEIVLRQMADYIERESTTRKRVKNAMTYPVILTVVAVIVIALLAVFVLPAFTGLYSSFGVEPPLPARILLAFSDWLINYGLYLLIAVLVAAAIGYTYIKTPAGRYQWHRLSLRAPIVGRINLLNELSRCCRTMALLFKVGLPLPEILNLATSSSDNNVIAQNITEVQQELIRGEGLSGPMAKRGVFLPLMTQMVKVGEETGNLDQTLTTVAISFETEADDKTNAAVGLIQPVMTIFIGLIIAFVALTLVSSMYSVYGQIGL